MSDALSFLVRARPQAMGHYLAFMKDAGSRLDPKTRNLISVITKVHAQTERGLRQYLKRALNEGCTPAEVIDALLMAFPALGLSKIIWAVDVILAMKLPGFDPAALESAVNAGSGATAATDTLATTSAPAATAAPATSAGIETAQPTWHALPDALAMPPDSVRRIDVDGQILWLWRDAAGFRVYDGRCPHEDTPLTQGPGPQGRLVCRRHRWAFDPASGDCVAEGNRPLRRYESRLRDGSLQALW